MKIIKKSITPNGEHIQIESWKEDYSCFDTYLIATYPTMKKQPISKKVYGMEIGKPFRVEISRGFTSDDEVLQVFQQLENGEKNIKDFREKFWDLWCIECL